MSSRVLCLLAAGMLLMLFAACACAQTAAIEPGDTIKITVLGLSDLSTQTVIDNDGKATLPLIGSISLAGKSTTQAAADIRKALLKYVKNPEVTVEMAAKVKSIANIAGNINKPGSYEISSKTTLVQLIALAGGTGPNADLSKVQLIRSADKSISIINLQAFIDGKDTSTNPVIYNGDVVSVPESLSLAGYAYIYGEVRKSGACELRTGMRVHEALALVGGTTEMADTSACSLKHASGEEVKINLVKALAQDPKEDAVLASGDSLYVPALSGSFNINGAVNRPGSYPVKGQMTIIDALTMAGGYSPNARIDQVRILRADSKAEKVDVVKIEQGKQQNVAVMPGDTISVPQTKGGANIWSIVGSVAGFAWIFAR